MPMSVTGGLGIAAGLVGKATGHTNNLLLVVALALVLITGSTWSAIAGSRALRQPERDPQA